MQTTSTLLSAKTLESNITYEILQRPKEPDGRVLPQQLGKGRFAKVYKAIQRSVGRNMRLVALKVLHDYVDHSAERLFRQEIDLMRGLADTATVNVVNMLDIVHIGPSVMCGGCGTVYHPLCPDCGERPLNRKTPQPPFPSHPSLYCENCKFELTAQEVQRYEYKLLSPKTKICCTANVGTILNFVDRDAIVMELVDTPGDAMQNSIMRFVRQREDAMANLLARYQRSPVQGAPLRSMLSKLRSLWNPEWDDLIAAKVLLLEKVGLMQQLAEAVAWLHSEKKIVHKDLAPDNVLVRLANDELGEGRWRGNLAGSLGERLKSLVSSQSFGLKVIDFGLADKEELSRSWYEEEDVKAVWIKRPYISPEAYNRKEPVSGVIFETEPLRCRLPIGLIRTELSVMPGDILSDVSDTTHDHDLEIEQVTEEPPGTGNFYAYFSGTPQAASQNRQFELVRRLGEPHDIYALGGLFFYILTGQDKPVELLKAFVDLLQKSPCELTISAVWRRNRADYQILRSAIPEPFWLDDLMLLVLRSMVRGQPQSYVQSRVDRGPRAAQLVLREVSRIYRELQQEVLAAHRVRKLRRLIAGVSLAGIGLAGLVRLLMR